MEQQTHEPAPAGQKTTLIWIMVTIFTIVVISALVFIYVQSKNIQSLKQTITELENQPSTQKTESQTTPLVDKQTAPEEISFDDCGKLSKYENEPWYPELAKNTTLNGDL